MKKHLTSLLAVCLLLAMTLPAHALEYSFEQPEPPHYGKPSSVEVVITPDGGAEKNEDISKNAARIPPGFGSAMSNTLHTGEYLTPNLVPSAMAATGEMVSGGAAVVFPPDMSGLSAEAVPADLSAGSTIVPGSSTLTVESSGSSGYTEVTDDLYYRDGSLGTLEIPAIGLSVNIFQGTDAATLKRGVGHFEDTSIWDGNASFAAHNRGANSYFGKIHTLELGDRITLTTKLGTRTYEVTSVSKVSETDRSALAASQSNVITLYTCVRDQRDLRWCITGMEVV